MADFPYLPIDGTVTSHAPPTTIHQFADGKRLILEKSAVVLAEYDFLYRVSGTDRDAIQTFWAAHRLAVSFTIFVFDTYSNDALTRSVLFVSEPTFRRLGPNKYEAQLRFAEFVT